MLHYFPAKSIGLKCLSHILTRLYTAEPMYQIQSGILYLKAKHLNQSKDNLSPCVPTGILCFYAGALFLSLHISLSFCSFSFICFNILYPDESGDGVLTWRLNPRRVHYGKTGPSADRGGEIQHRGQRIHMATWLYSPVGLSSLLCILFVYSTAICACVCVCVHAIALCSLSHGFTRIYHMESYGQLHGAASISQYSQISPSGPNPVR